jgi:S-adenosylmethionine synthetase
MPRNYFFSSESVTEGHPDKICDIVSDSILDACLAQDPKSRVACETTVKTGFVLVAGEITTHAVIEVPALIRKAVNDIGYTDSAMGFDGNTCAILNAIEKQSPDISQGVTEGEGLFKEQGAGDQGMMFGYAVDEAPEFMPASIYWAHRLTEALSAARREGRIPHLRPDGKSQVTFEHRDGKPVRVDAVVISSQHRDDITHEELTAAIKQEVIHKTLPAQYLDNKTKYFINPTGRFVIGGPMGDAGLTGRKIIVDSYGGHGAHGGGAFSGKDPSKVDRSAAYAARYMAKNVVASGYARRCLVQLAYAIGVAEPLSLFVDSFGTASVDDERIATALREVFPVKPADIISQLRLQRPIYKQTAAYGHFGRKSGDGFTWENTDKVAALKQMLG